MVPKTFQEITIPFLNTEGLNSKTEKFFSEPTLYLLIAFALFMLAKPTFGTPTICHMPADLPKESTVNYMNTFCYYAQKQRTKINKIIDRGYGRGNMTLNVLTGTSDYYMWMPFIGILQVTLCILPVLFWKVIGLNFFHGADIICLLENDINTDDDQLREKGFVDERRVWQIQNWVNAKSAAIYGKSRTLLVYVIMKWFRLAVFMFLFWMNANLFAAGDLYWGYDIIKDFMNGTFQNPLKGEFTLITGCQAQRLQNGVAVHGGVSAYTVVGQCILSGNFINAKVFLFLYWWFILLIIVCFFSGVRYTLILASPGYRRYLFKSLIRDEEYYTKRRGPPSADLYLGMSEPLDYLSDYLGNDGYLFVQIVYDSLSYFQSDKMVMDIWTLVIVNNGKSFPKYLNKEELKAAKEKAEKDKETFEKQAGEVKQDKSEKKPPVEDTEHDGGGDGGGDGDDRLGAGNDKEKVTIIEETVSNAPPLENDSETASLLLPAPVDDGSIASVPVFDSPAPSTASIHVNEGPPFFDDAV